MYTVKKRQWQTGRQTDTFIQNVYNIVANARAHQIIRLANVPLVPNHPENEEEQILIEKLFWQRERKNWQPYSWHVKTICYVIHFPKKKMCANVYEC